jgi:hypothetical protein
MEGSKKSQIKDEPLDYKYIVSLMKDMGKFNKLKPS